MAEGRRKAYKNLVPMTYQAVNELGIHKTTDVQSHENLVYYANNAVDSARNFVRKYISLNSKSGKF